MKKYSVIAIALMLMLALTACRSSDMPETTNGTSSMPTVVTTMPTMGTTEPDVPGTSFTPDDDGIIGQTSDPTGTTGTTGSADASSRMRIMR